MSHRTRRILPASIITVILIGLVLALAFCAAMWLPVNPLRFRPISYLEDDMVPLGFPVEGSHLVHMTVDNTSNSTVYLRRAFVSTADKSRISENIAYLTYEEQTMLGLPVAISGVAMVLPPRSTVHCLAVVPSGRDAELSLGTASVRYTWSTGERYQLMAAIEHLYILLPARFQSYLPAPSERHDTIPLELPPSSPAP